MRDIDIWIEQHVPQHRNGCVIHTESIGSVVDKLAAAYVCADIALDNIQPRDPVVHKAWCRVAELVEGYTDLIADVALGRRRLPSFSTPR